ncbi:CYTH domain-containing protein [Desulfogranum japonicum]|uniref:CYTH domain-containing protein n=1 Tax=Desulfogranum japonicum TaxID=231447 RepID=UPI00041BE371|nr:CYTH domain-containing protein [Desulfogranum japonicum]
MAKEIERKFLVASDGWQHLARGIHYRQGYICSGKGQTVRVRVVENKGILTIKGATQGISRSEYEYPIPLDDALEMLEELCEKPIIVKKRYHIYVAGFTWEVDQFLDENEGLVIAEIELSHENQSFNKPEWIGTEVTGIPRYYNACLHQHPYNQWNPEEIAVQEIQPSENIMSTMK